MQPFRPNKLKYSELWVSAIRRTLIRLRVVRMIKEFSAESEVNLNVRILERTTQMIKQKTLVVVPFGIFEPRSRIKELWNFYVGILLIYTATVTPIIISFINSESNDAIFIIDLIIDMSFILDFILNLNTAFYDEDNCLICSRLLIIKQYYKNGLLLDSFSCIPFSLLDLTSKGYSTIFRLAKLRALSRLLKLSRLFKAITGKDYSIIKSLQMMLSISHNFMKIFKFAVLIIISINLAACLWHWIAVFDAFGPNTWVYRYGAVDDPVFRRYILSIYWAISTLSTVGYGDIYAYTVPEKIVAMLWMSYAIFNFAFAISSISSMLSQIDLKKTLLRQQMVFIDNYSSQVKLSRRLKKSLQQMLISSIDRLNYSYSDRMQLLSQFPKPLKLEIAFTMHKGFISRFELFNKQDEDFLLDVLPLLQNFSVQTSEIIYSYGETANKIYFLISGRVNFLLADEKIVFQVIAEGGYFGDLEVIGGEPRLSTARAAKESRLMAMGTDIIKKIRRCYLKFYLEMKEAADRRRVISHKAMTEIMVLTKLKRSELIEKSQIGKVKELIRSETINLNKPYLDIKENILRNIKAAAILKKSSKSLQECKSTLIELHNIADKLVSSTLNH